MRVGLSKLCVLILLTTGCSKFEPVVDLRASEDKAHLYQRDLTECRMLASTARGWIDKALISDSPMVTKCLEGRGHNVLNNPS